jgi:addiction module RelB/DinJ family antitoxin
MKEIINIEVDPIALDRAKEIFDSYGLSSSDAINIFLHKVQKDNGLLFELEDEEFYDTPKEKVLKDLKEAVKEVKLYEQGKIELKDARELLDEL